ncbi:methyl-accepting chemotaxis protein [Solibacillus sp. FSL W7-1324]|uniref:methyl-accepting chemotaxis protein n=1 Tax=Solibacillus sp. FSL W7-1324 TaxID=2921701 RepID=UPI0030F84F12
MKFFLPIIKLLNKLKYPMKFSVIGIILLVPLLLVSLFYLSTMNDEMKQIEKRVEGATCNTALKDILQYSQQTRALNVSLLTDTASAKQLDEVIEKVNQAFGEIEKLDSKMEYDFNTKEQFQAIQEKWNTLQQTTWKDSGQITSQYSDYIEDILNLMTDVTNNSELLLTDSKEMFNLTYNTFIELPKLTEQFGQMRALGVSIINSNAADEVQVEQLNMIYFPTQSAIKNMNKSSAVIFNNPEFEAALQQPLDLVKESAETYFKAIDSIGKGAISATDYYDIATASNNTNFEFYTASLEEMEITLQQQSDNLQQTMVIIFITLSVIFIVALLLFVSLFLAIRQSIKLLEEGTMKVAGGDLNVKVALHTNDEMKNVETSFNSMIIQLNGLVREITTSAEHVASSSEELHASAEEATAAVEHTTTAVNQMMTDTEIQEVRLNESAQAMNEMVTGIERIAENSVRISALTNETTGFANDGNTTVEKALQQMDMIKQTVGKSSEKINDLNKQSTKIDSIVRVISDIADQTNLLALNAAIEAARAGENGKGFAVVADEVRKLAEESRGSAKQIAELIETIQIDTTDSVKMMSLVTDNVDVGIKVTEETAYKFGHILTSMQTLNPQMEEISATATEFSAQAEQVASAMQHLLEMAKQTSEATAEIASTSEEQLAIMEEVSSSANSLSEIAESLQSLVMQFKL